MTQKKYDLKKDERYLRLLAKSFPNIADAATEIINLEAIAHLPKGTEHFLADIHGEYQAFQHVLKNASGNIKRKVNELFGERLRNIEKQELCTLIYYPEQKLELVKKEEKDIKDWYHITIHRLIEVCRDVSSKYTRSKVRKSLPDDFSYIIQELLHEHADDKDKTDYVSAIIKTIISTGRADDFIIAICEVIQRLVIDQLPEVESARQRLAEHAIRAIIQGVVTQARRGQLPVSDIPAEIAQRLEQKTAHSLQPVINATGVIIHTNLGRAPLPSAAVEALQAAASYTDVEMDLDSGKRSRNRGAGATAALLAACPGAEDALVVNNGASALLLATAALAPGKEVIISRGELIEIGAGFRLPELIESTATRLKEVGATNRTHLADYECALGDNTGAILKVHPSNFRIEGFTSAVGVEDLHRLAVEHDTRLIVDLGSGLRATEKLIAGGYDDIGAGAQLGLDIWFLWQRWVMGEQAGAQVHDESRIVLHR